MSKARELAELGAVYDSGALSNRNLVINGAMQVAQRSTSVASVSDGSNEGYQSLDRFALYYSNSAGGVCTISQDTTVPSGYGFSNSYKVDVTTADTSISSTHVIFIQHSLEAREVRNSGWNYTSSSSNITLSFWARSTKAGTYNVLFRAIDVGQKYYVAEYTLVADTWKKVTVTVPGDSSLVFNNDTDSGLTIRWNLQCGSDRDNASTDAWLAVDAGNQGTSNQVNFFDSTSNDFYLTGVQLEVGTEATPFEHRSFGQELALCQRYFEKTDQEGSDTYRLSMNKGNTSDAYYWPIGFRVTKRAKPATTLTQTFDDNLDLGVHAASTGRNHMGVTNASGGSTDTRALAEFTWTADAEL